MDIQSKRKINNLFINTTSRDPSFLYAFRSSFDITSQIEMDWWLRYTSPASGIFTTQAIPSYVTLDMRLAWQPVKQLELAFIANNLNNDHHAEFYDAVALNPLHVERMFWLQAHVKF
ncbi:TonB-dependent receptor [Methylocucumis oryzae]|nr:TonB-dependent receptor [Methylocucumis oryzae]